jgi:hypothetical protein
MRHAARFATRLADLAGATPEFPNTEGSFCIHVVTCPNQGNKSVNCRSGIYGPIWRKEVYADYSLHGESRKFLDETDV